MKTQRYKTFVFPRTRHRVRLHKKTGARRSFVGIQLLRKAATFSLLPDREVDTY